MQHDATAQDVDRVVNVIKEMGYEARPMPGAQRTAVGLVGNDGRVDSSRIEALPGVAQVIHVTEPYKQVSREWKPESTVVTLGPGVSVGGDAVVVIGGPCSVESEEQILSAARIVKAAGGNALRGGAFKPRSSPYSFQGMGRKGLELLALARKETGLPIVTEAMDSDGAQMVAELADCIQIGARNMQNYSLLKTVGRMKKPVLLKRGMAATINELLLSAEYILAEGNENVILCERGVRSFDPARPPAFAPADHRRSESRDRTAGQGDPDGSRRRCRGRGRCADRSASRARSRAVGRRTIAVSGSVHSAGQRASRGGRRYRPQHPSRENRNGIAVAGYAYL
jgi:3-deoxy-7-phosphoheptulonate synthase